jgi:predicted nucleotidyltransferase
VSYYSDEHIRFLKHLLDSGVKFILIGGHAAIYYGVNRNTGDLDILIEPTQNNGKQLLNALRNMGLELPHIEPLEFESKLVLSFGVEPDAVDILNYTPGIEFTSAFQNALKIDFSGLKIPIIDIQDLIKNKESLERHGEKSHLDKYDVEVLKRILKTKAKD